MLEFLKGTIASTSEGAAVVEIGGVGIRVEMPTADLSRAHGDVTVLTVMQIRDEEVKLYGFLTERSRDLFKELTSVSGVGPKVALAVLSFHQPEGLERAISTGDAGALQLVPGVGKKTAERIVVDLRDKIGSITEAAVATAPAGSAVADVREALKGLGYSAQEIQDALSDLPPDGDAPTLLRHAMRALGGAETNGVAR